MVLSWPLSAEGFTAVNLMLFSLLHNPCSTTLYTIYKETNSGPVADFNTDRVRMANCVALDDPMMPAHCVKRANADARKTIRAMLERLASGRFRRGWF